MDIIPIEHDRQDGIRCAKWMTTNIMVTMEHIIACAATYEAANNPDVGNLDFLASHYNGEVLPIKTMLL